MAEYRIKNPPTFAPKMVFIITLFISAICAAAVCGAYCLGKADGISRGRNLQWVDDYFENSKKKIARDELGRFSERKK